MGIDGIIFDSSLAVCVVRQQESLSTEPMLLQVENSFSERYVSRGAKMSDDPF